MNDLLSALCIALCILVLIDILIRLLKRRPKKEVEENIISMVNEGHEQGVLEANEATMINNIFKFGDKEAGDIMTNRSNIVGIDYNSGLIETLNFMLSNNNSRYPVYVENLDNIVGVLYLKDVMRFHAKDETVDGPLSDFPDLKRKASVVPETTKIDDLFTTMRSNKVQMSIVVDEYGQTVGLVSMEDILEEIVGNILDEYDVEEKHIQDRGRGIYIVDGSTPLNELEEKFGIKFDDDRFETINGFLISKLDRLPEKDEHFEIEFCGYLFSVRKVENRMISKVSVKKVIKEMKDEE